jgi:cyclohexadieny/prephenate dehydrogenase
MKNILIIGCGLLGSSLVRSISKKKIAKKIFIYEKSNSNISKIKKLKLPGIILKSFKNGIVNSDLIIFCTPMSEYKNLILKMNKFISSETLITDIGSSKTESSIIIKKFLKKGIDWTRCHPIAGSEVSGPEHGKDNMFEDKWCVLIKDKKTNLQHLKLLNSFWRKVGSKTVIMNSEKHDKIFSITSHLPHLIAYNLVKSAQDFEKILKFNLIKYSAGGLRDFSRIAASNEIMWRDIFFDNKVNITKAIDLFIKNLKSFKKDINRKNNKSILKKLTQTKKVRSKIIKLKQDINKPDFGRFN